MEMDVKVTPSDDNQPLVTPIYQSAKFSLPNLEEIRRLFRGERSGYLYSRFSNPTVRELELTLAKMQGVEDGIACASGVSAISSTLFTLLGAGDRLLLFIESYKPTRYLANHYLKKWGVEVIYASLQDTNIVESIKRVRPRVVLFESITNPCLYVADVEAIAKAARQVGAITVLDNTFAGLFEYHNVGIDLYIHSLSKLASGHGDVIAGAVLGSKKRIEKLRYDFVQIGAALDPHAAYLVSRGLKTLALREKAQSEAAIKFADFLAHQSQFFTNIMYPGRADHPQFHLAQKSLKSPGYVVSCDFKGTEQDMDRFLSRLKVIKITGSLGSTETIVAPSFLFYAGELTKDETQQAGIRPTTLRFSIGLEDMCELENDIKQALL